MRQIILDTETTGLRTEDGHRLIEIGCLEMIDRKLTGKEFHHYINPERDIDAGAMAVHGIKNSFVKDKPVFSAIAKEFMEFVSGAELIIHNAPFDVGFINYELGLARLEWKSLTDYCSVIDTLKIARQLHVGQRNSLDALCKRYGVDNSKREMHGALLDAYLLAHVYLAMTGGQGSFFDSPSENQPINTSKATGAALIAVVPKHKLVVIKPSDDENNEHASYLKAMEKKGKCLWNDD